MVGKVVVAVAKPIYECMKDPACSKEAAKNYTDYEVVRTDSDGVYVRCLPDKSYTKEERLWYSDGNYSATGWIGGGYPSLDEAAKLVCGIH